jgi:hypothetical protein
VDEAEAHRTSESYDATRDPRTGRPPNPLEAQQLAREHEEVRNAEGNGDNPPAEADKAPANEVAEENGSDESSPYLKGGEFKKEADKANKRTASTPSQEGTDWADLPPKEQDKRQRG